MRIAWVHSFPEKGIGAQVFLEEQLHHLFKIGIHVELLPTGSLYSISKIIKAEKKLFKEMKNYDLVHAQWGSGCGYVVSKLPIPKVMTLRGSDWYGSGGVGSIQSRMREWLGRYLSIKSLRDYNKIIVMSERMQEEIKMHISAERIIVNPTGINLELIKPTPREHARNLLGFPDDNRPWILFATSKKNYAVKRARLAYEAFEYCRQTIPNAKLVELIGVSREKIPLFMSAGNVLLLTSIHEGWPNVVKEALACNTPFVSTDVSDLKKITTLTNICKIAEASPQALGDALIKTLLSNSLENIRVHVQEMSLEKTAFRLKETYESCLV